MGKKHLTPIESMLVAVNKVNVQPIMNEIHKYPFLWVLCLIALFFVIGNLFEILWLIFRDLRRVCFKILRLPRKYVKSKVDIVKHYLIKRYGKKRRDKRGLRNR